MLKIGQRRRLSDYPEGLDETVESGIWGDSGSPTLVDAETALPNRRQFLTLLQRDIARGLRYGDQMALAVFGISIAGFTPTTAEPYPPSPAREVADILLTVARQADLVARLDMARFVVVLVECNERGAEIFGERTRTKLSTKPYARDSAGKGIYVRAWSGAAIWRPDFASAEEYLDAAIERMERSRSELDSIDGWYKGGR